MSLLKQDTTSDVPPYGDDETYEGLDHFPAANLDTTDAFAEDADDDELSLDGIYDEDEDAGYLPPKYHMPLLGHGKSGMDNVAIDNAKGARMYGTLPTSFASSSYVGLGLANSGSSLQTPGYANSGSSSRIAPGPADTGNSSYISRLATNFAESSLNPPSSPNGPYDAETIRSDEFGMMSSGPPVPLKGYYPGIDVCIVSKPPLMMRMLFE